MPAATDENPTEEFQRQPRYFCVQQKSRAVFEFVFLPSIPTGLLESKTAPQRSHDVNVGADEFKGRKRCGRF